MFHKQFRLEANDYTTHEKWRNDFRHARDCNIFYLGSGDETCGNQLCQLTRQEDGSFNMILRKEKAYRASNKIPDREVRVDGIEFQYLSDWLDIALKEGSPVTYRISRNAKKWYLIASFTFVSSPITYSQYGVVGCDYNDGFIEAVETDKTGNMVNICHIKLEYHGCGNKAQTEAEQKISKFVRDCARLGKDIVIEDLSFVKRKAKTLCGQGKKYNKRIHLFDYTRYMTLMQNLCSKYGVVLHKVNPAYTSKIGKQKYCYKKKLSVHQAAAYVIARRGQGFKDR